MKIETLKAIINAFNAASKDPTRYTLNCVRVEINGSKLTIEASDGHILSTVTLTDEDFSGNESRIYAVQPHNLPLLKLLLKSAKKLPGVEHNIMEDGTVNASFDGVTVSIKTAKSEKIEFPDFEQVKPKPADDAFTIAFNPELLSALFESLKQEKRTKGAKLTFTKGVGPILVEVDGQKGALMPMRV